MSDANWNQEAFNVVLERYVDVTRKDMVTVLNTKGYFIARKALWFTRKTEKPELDKLRTARTRSGGLLVGAMISKRLGKGAGLYGWEMAQAVDKLLESRQRATAFMKSGWLTAIRGLDPKAENKSEASPIDRGAKQIGQPKGSFSPALETRLVVELVNTAQAKSDRRDALNTIGLAGLNFAFDDETASMTAYIDRKLKQRAEEANIKL